jgi:D-galactarolactone isomerase
LDATRLTAAIRQEGKLSDTKPRLTAPAGAWDCHIHVYDPRMKLAPNAAGPGPAWASAEAYRQVRRRLGVARAVVVQPTAYGSDNSCTMAAVAALGAADTRAVVVVAPDVTDTELERLHEGGARGVRFQMLPAGGALPWGALEPVAARIAPLGWHIQLQMDGRFLAEREAQLGGLPTKLIIDHVGKFLEPVPVEHAGFQALLRLLGNGRTWLKLAAAYEVSKAGPPLYADVGALAKAAVKAAPERMIWASNWPHVSVRDLPDDAGLLDLLLDWAPDEAVRHRILVENPQALYA